MSFFYLPSHSKSYLDPYSLIHNLQLQSSAARKKVNINFR